MTVKFRKHLGKVKFQAEAPTCFENPDLEVRRLQIETAILTHWADLGVPFSFYALGGGQNHIDMMIKVQATPPAPYRKPISRGAYRGGPGGWSIGATRTVRPRIKGADRDRRVGDVGFAFAVAKFARGFTTNTAPGFFKYNDDQVRSVLRKVVEELDLDTTVDWNAGMGVFVFNLWEKRAST